MQTFQSFVKHRNIDMTDLRQARQIYSDKKLEIIIKVLERLNDETDDIPLYKLCRKAGLSESQLKLHHRYAEHFFQDWGTYGEAVDSLKKKCISKVRKSVIEKLTEMNFTKKKEPPLELILHIAKRMPKCDWMDSNSFTSTWAKDLRLDFRETKINRKRMKNRQSKKFLLYVDWVQEYFESHDKVSYLTAKEKHREIIGKIKSSRAWNNFSSRVRRRANLNYLKDKSKPKGDLQHYWVKN